MGLRNAKPAINKALDVNNLIVESDLDVLCLTETGLMEAGDAVSRFLLATQTTRIRERR